MSDEEKVFVSICMAVNCWVACKELSKNQF